MTLGEYLRDLRKATGLSQNGLAREAGVNVAYINRIENGKYVRPSRQIVLSLVLALRINRPEADRLLWLAGLATLEDWQTTANNRESALRLVRRYAVLLEADASMGLQSLRASLIQELVDRTLGDYPPPIACHRKEVTRDTGRTTDPTPPEDRYRSGHGQ